ncbi:synaptophysin-like protein 1 [Bacillus rossius redtenbacheri]|uniref:synaptophysin-like protein 1 n=1 Tax=Bacillus rossius redtenbacheri TaxID=93214 RepID=UPI002FDD290D
MDHSQITKPDMELSLAVFKEPRGVMRILQFIFSICAFATTTGFTSDVILTVRCDQNSSYPEMPYRFEYSYPFRLDTVMQTVCDNPFHLVGDFSSDAQFFVATGVLSFLYCIFIGIVYLLYDALYQRKDILPLADFVLTVVLAVFWLSGSAAWANGLSGLKQTTGSINNSKQCDNIICLANPKVGSVTELNISVILGFLNFFLWGSDLWFLYKETSWFKAKQTSSGMATTA